MRKSHDSSASSPALHVASPRKRGPSVVPAIHPASPRKRGPGVVTAPLSNIAFAGKPRWLIVAAALLFSSVALAQEQPPQQPPAEQGARIPPFVKKTAELLIDVFNSPLHPVVRGVASGGGLGAGVAYEFSPFDRWEARMRGIVTMNDYTSLQADLKYEGDDYEFGVYARKRDMKELNFYGPGPDSEERLRTNFRLIDQSIGVRGSMPVLTWLRVGARVENLLPGIREGRSTLVPTLRRYFGDAEAPGLSVQPRFMRYEGIVDVRLPAAAGEGLFQGAVWRATYAVFDDIDLGRYDFQRIDLEAKHRFAGFAPHQRLTLHGWLSTTTFDVGDDVPFYLQRTLGGRSNLRTVDEDLLGGDDTQSSLRGFRSYRFRDKHLMLLQAEYRVPLWGPFDATVFVDAGKVAPRFSELDFSNLRSDYGFSLSVMRGEASMLRFDVALGSGEGARLLFNLGRDILP